MTSDIASERSSRCIAIFVAIYVRYVFFSEEGKRLIGLIAGCFLSLGTSPCPAIIFSFSFSFLGACLFVMVKFTEESATTAMFIGTLKFGWISFRQRLRLVFRPDRSILNFYHRCSTGMVSKQLAVCYSLRTRSRICYGL